MRPLVAALALLAIPALAQDAAPPESGPIAAAAEVEVVDPAIVGAWSLDEVVETGRLGALGVKVEDMACAFGAEGTARVEMEMVQDLDPITRDRTFTFQTEAGRILVPDDDAVGYQVLEDGRLEMTTSGGLVVRFVRSRS